MKINKKFFYVKNNILFIYINLFKNYYYLDIIIGLFIERIFLKFDFLLIIIHSLIIKNEVKLDFIEFKLNLLYTIRLIIYIKNLIDYFIIIEL